MSHTVLIGFLLLGSGVLHGADETEGAGSGTQQPPARPETCPSGWLCSAGASGFEATTPSSVYPSNLRVTTETGRQGAHVTDLGAFSSRRAGPIWPVLGDEPAWGEEDAPLFESENDSAIYRLSQMENLSLMTFWEKDDAALTLGITRDGLAGISFGPKSRGEKKDGPDDPPPTPGEALNFVTGEGSGLDFVGNGP